MTVLYILAQFFAALGIVFALISVVIKTKRWMLSFMSCKKQQDIQQSPLTLEVIRENKTRHKMSHK